MLFIAGFGSGEIWRGQQQSNHCCVAEGKPNGVGNHVSTIAIPDINASISWPNPNDLNRDFGTSPNLPNCQIAKKTALSFIYADLPFCQGMRLQPLEPFNSMVSNFRECKCEILSRLQFRYVIDLEPQWREEMIVRSGRFTVRRIFIDGTHIEDGDKQSALDNDGDLDRLAHAQAVKIRARLGEN